MNNTLFDPKYIYRAWDDSLQGKQGFVGDSWFDVLMHFHSGETANVEPSDDFDFPFRPTRLIPKEGVGFRMFYYDSALEAKIALTEGKTVIAHYLNKQDLPKQVSLDWDWQANEEYIDFYEIMALPTTPKANALFDPKFVHFLWNPDLAGNLCFFADSIGSLQKLVESGYTEAMRYPKRFKSPFGDEIYIFQAVQSILDISGVVNQFCYYDPLYEVKLGFYRGVPVEHRLYETFSWELDRDPSWDISQFEYRLASH